MTLSYLRKVPSLGENGTAVVIARLIIDYLDFASITNINENTVRDLVALIMEDYSWLGIYDMALFCRMMKKNQFSKCFGAMNAPQIFTWLGEYVIARGDVFERLNKIQERKRLEAEMAKIEPATYDVDSMIQRIRDKMKKIENK